MTTLFYFLWLLALGKIALAPLMRLTTKLFFLLTIGVGLWIIVGAFVYQSQYSTYEMKKKSFEIRKTEYQNKVSELETLSLKHPTSRDIALHQASIAFAFGDREKLLRTIEILRQVDPNNTKVKEFLHSLQ